MEPKFDTANSQQTLELDFLMFSSYFKPVIKDIGNAINTQLPGICH